MRRFPKGAINLHISYLPWNRGADPLLWSLVEQTPIGVSIHEIDAGIDTGPLYAQRRIGIDRRGTLRTAYAELQTALTELFIEVWPLIVAGQRKACSQPAGGSFHRKADRAKAQHFLRNGWDTAVEDLRRECRNLGASAPAIDATDPT